MFTFNIIYITQSIAAEMQVYFDCGQGEFERNCNIYFEGDKPPDVGFCEEHHEQRLRRRPFQPAGEAPPFAPYDAAEIKAPLEELPHELDWYIT